MSYEQLLPELQKYMPGYEKSKKYFVRTELYEFLVKHGNLDQAMKNGETLSILASAHPEDKIAYSQVARVLKLLEQMKEDVR